MGTLTQGKRVLLVDGTWTTGTSRVISSTYASGCKCCWKRLNGIRRSGVTGPTPPGPAAAHGRCGMSLHFFVRAMHENGLNAFEG